MRGLGEIALRPLELFGAAVLSPAGWRLPEFSEVRIAEIAIAGDGVRLSFSSEPARWRRRARARQGWLASRSCFCAAILRRDRRLPGGDPAEPDSAQPLTKHLLDLLCSRDSSLREAELIARDALLRWPDFLHARLSLAAAAAARD